MEAFSTKFNNYQPTNWNKYSEYTIISKVLRPPTKGINKMPNSQKRRTIKNMYQAFKSADYKAFTDLCTPDIIWAQNKGFPNGTISHGPQQIIDNVFKSFSAQWDAFTFNPEHYFYTHDKVIVEGHYVGTPKGKTQEISADACHIYTLTEDNLISHFQQYTDTKTIQDAIS